MSDPLKYYSVNWVDGMKINKDHFIQQDQASNDKLRDSISAVLNSMNYGLLPLWNIEKDGFNIISKIDNQRHLKVKIVMCRALTHGGARIEILEEHDLEEFLVDLSPEMSRLKQDESKLHYILLTTNVFERKPWGELLSDEDPPRYPFVNSLYSMQVVEEKQLERNDAYPYSLVIGKIMVHRDKPQIAEDYIPPCMSIKSHRELVSFHASIDKFLHQMELYLLSIIRKIKEKEQSSTLAQSTLRLSKNILDFLNHIILPFKWEIVEQPPVFLFGKIAGIARVMRNTIDSETSTDKEELLNYFTNWSELKQGDLEKLLVYCINFEYEHHEVSNSIEQFNEFSQIILGLFTKLESLAYIGKKKETGIFVKEHKSKRSFLAD